MDQSTDRALRTIGQSCSSECISTARDDREAHASDASDMAPSVPAAVLRPRNTEDIAAILGAASRHGLAITPRGGGTSRVGGAIPSPNAAVLLTAHLDAVDDLDRQNRTLLVGPGLLTAQAQRVAKEAGLMYAPDPNSRESCCIGGNVGANAAGPRAYKYGPTSHHVLGLEFVTAAGERIELGRQTRKGVTGYDVSSLVVGSEGTLGVVTKARLRLITLPERVATLAIFLPSEASLLALTQALADLRQTRCIELLDAITLSLMQEDAGLPIPTGTGLMALVELDGEEREVELALARCQLLCEAVGAVDIVVAQNQRDRDRIWRARSAMSYAIRRRAAHKLSEDVVVPLTRVGDLLATCRELSERYRLTLPTYGHAGDGNLHINFLWNEPEERARVDVAIATLFRRVIELGGTLSGEHGLGLSKAPYLPLEQSPALIDLQRRIKQAFDPKGIMNPGKVFVPAAAARHASC